MPNPVTQWIGLREAALAFVWVIAALALFFGAAIGVIHLLPVKPGWPWLLAGLAVGTAFAALGALRYGLLKRRGKTWRDIGFVAPARPLAPLLWQIPAIIVIAGLVQAGVMQLVFGGPVATGQESVKQALETGLSVPAAVAVFGIAVLTPLWEEALFRGFLFHALANRWPLVRAIPLTGLGFAAFHMLPPVMPFIFCLGTGAAWLTAHYRSLWPAVLLHAVNNGTLALAMLLGAAA